MRLIDKDELKERFCNENCGERRCIDNMDKCVWICSVEESKTAYDVDKVVEQLEEIKKIMTSSVSVDCIEGECKYQDCTVCLICRAIEIVKGGGIG